MSLVVFQKWSKMSRNFHKGEIFEKFWFWKSCRKIKKNEGYKSGLADSKNVDCLWSRGNILEIFGLKTHFMKSPKNCHISTVSDKMEPKVACGYRNDYKMSLNEFRKWAEIFTWETFFEKFWFWKVTEKNPKKSGI